MGDDYFRPPIIIRFCCIMDVHYKKNIMLDSKLKAQVSLTSWFMLCFC
jgi:hypothetical protein